MRKLASRKILLYPENEAALRKKCKPVATVNRRVSRLIRDLKHTLNDHADGIGLAAPQINVHYRVVVVRLGGRNTSEGRRGPATALVNPVILASGDDRRDFDGCLSFPGLFGKTVRPHYLRVAGLDERGDPFDRIFEGFDAVLVHHEIDHLDGVLFIDRIERLDDLYRIAKDEMDTSVRVPFSVCLPRRVQGNVARGQESQIERELKLAYTNGINSAQLPGKRP